MDSKFATIAQRGHCLRLFASFSWFHRRTSSLLSAPWILNHPTWLFFPLLQGPVQMLVFIGSMLGGGLGLWGHPDWFPLNHSIFCISHPDAGSNALPDSLLYWCIFTVRLDAFITARIIRKKKERNINLLLLSGRNLGSPKIELFRKYKIIKRCFVEDACFTTFHWKCFHENTNSRVYIPIKTRCRDEVCKLNGYLLLICYETCFASIVQIIFTCIRRWHESLKQHKVERNRLVFFYLSDL